MIPLRNPLHPSSSPALLQRHFARQVDGEPNASELRLDPSTGELVLTPRGTGKNTDGAVIDSIVEDGFFADEAEPRVVVAEGAFAGLTAGAHFELEAVAQDEGSVLHVVKPGGAPWRLRGARMRAAAVVVEAGGLEAWMARATRTAVDAGAPGQVALVVEAGSGRVAALVRRGEVLRRATVVTVPVASELLSRSRGVLESDLLASKRVAIAGVGSGGSAIAVDLAKAGVGSFVLIDADRLDPGNVSRHACGLGDVGRLKVHAVRDAIHERNPHARIEAHPVAAAADAGTAALLDGVDLLVGATDGNASRGALNRLALDLAIPALFGRALTRAAAGDVLRVRPQAGPCLACVFASGGFSGAEEEVSQLAQARRDAPAYVRGDALAVTVQPGLAADIAPISNMMTRLALVELTRGSRSGLESLEADLEADYFVWANRRERAYAALRPMAFATRDMSILRWYPVRATRMSTCMECGQRPVSTDPSASLLLGAPPAWSERAAAARP